MEDPGAEASQPISTSSHKGDKRGNKDRGPKAKTNKRTKTGCLTCRKRRIKCDEAKPECKNCVKSRRNCEGYNQRVTFKETYGTFPGNLRGPTVYHPGISLDAFHQGVAGSSAQGVLQAIAPKPPSLDLDQLGQNHRQQQLSPQYMSSHLNIAQSRSKQLPHVPQVQVAQDDLSFLQHNNFVDFVGDFEQGGSQSSSNIFPVPMSADSSSYRNQPQPSPIAQSNVSSNFRGLVPVSHSRRLGTPSGPRGLWMFDIPEQPVIEYSYDVPMWNSGDDDTGEDDMAESDDGEPDVDQFVLSISSAETRIREFSYHHQHLDDFKSMLFRHFVQVTGPCISMYERLPCNNVAIEQLCPDPHRLGPNLWSHTFPLLSQGHPALQRAILAIAGLQLAKLQGSNSVFALKQYQLAINRLRKNARTPTRIRQPASLAASLLLAYFDVWKSDHAEWSTQLFAARVIFHYLGLRKMSHRCLRAKLKRQKKAEEETRRSMGSFFPTSSFNIKHGNDAQYINFDLLQTITGFPVLPEDYGVGEGFDADPDYTVGSSNARESRPRGLDHVTDKEIREYENLRDLFWWYCKMDVYQSMLGATRLFMNYEYWTECPPRAPVNRIDAIYGTYDHLMLLLGRLATFHSRDMDRKREVQKQKAEGIPSPAFMGILPANPVQPWPTGWGEEPAFDKEFNKPPEEPPMTYGEALREWEKIEQAFVIIARKLGPDFQPLHRQSHNTPFGPALQYQTYAVAGIWMNYYMGMINLYRAHPSMPPAAADAARAAAQKTSFHANMVGRIAAGLVEDCTRIQASDVLICAALIESAFCLFVAAIQFKSEAQRQWLVQRMHDITRITGWQSAQQIANGCESAWIKGHERGTGPVHNPSNLNNRPPVRVMRNPRRLDEAINSQVEIERVQRAHYALGLLEVEGDMGKLNLRDS